MAQPKYLGGMGFRKMELFNLALLAKQGWRLLQAPESLSARILRALYFPNGEFLSASLGSRPSQIWRSILDGREVLKQGLIRRIGDGNLTHVWNDNWLPREAMLRHIAPRQVDKPELVSELIDQVTLSWNEQKLAEHFLPMDADIIRKIPLATTRFDDCWSWFWEKNGNFSVRSAYRMLIHTRNRREIWLEGGAGSSNPLAEERSWTRMWKHKIPVKVKVFAWRLARQSLPTADVAHHRNMAQESTCLVCGVHEDSWRHSLLECRMARSVWVLVDEDLYDQIRWRREEQARHWLFELDEALSEQDYVKVIVTMWALWKAKRDLVHEDKWQSPFVTSKFVEHFLREQKELETPQVRLPRDTAAPRRWTPPPVGSVKGNVDGAISVTKGRGAAAAIFRSGTGTFLGASVLVCQGMIDPASIEAIACREALCLARDLNIQKGIVASDSSEVVRAIREGSKGLHAMVIKEIQNLVHSVGDFMFSHERREDNVDAHNIARTSLDLEPGRHVWLLEPPGYVRTSILNE